MDLYEDVNRNMSEIEIYEGVMHSEYEETYQLINS